MLTAYPISNCAQNAMDPQDDRCCHRQRRKRKSEAEKHEDQRCTEYSEQ